MKAGNSQPYARQYIREANGMDQMARIRLARFVAALDLHLTLRINSLHL
jgi:hypothetical protein